MPEASPSTPARSPPAPAASAVNSTTPSNTPACLERRNGVIARSQHARSRTPRRASPSFLTRLLRSPLVDLYANRAQHHMVYLFVWHIFFFFLAIFDRDAGCFQGRDGVENPVNLGLYYAWYDEMLPFCLYTALALLRFRDWRTVSKWEFVAMAGSWAKSIVVLHKTYENVSAGGDGPVKFPNNKVDYIVFALVRLLVFGGLWKMVQAGLTPHWERSWSPEPPPPRVVRPHRAVPARLQRKVGYRIRRAAPRNLDPLDTLEGRKAYWAEIRERGW